MQAPPPGPEQLTTQLDALDTGVQKVVEDFQAAVIEGRAERWEPATLDAVAARVRQHSGRLRAYVEFYVARAVSSQGRVSKARDDLRAFVAVMDPKRHLWAPCLLCRSLFADLARTAGDMHEAITVLRAAPPIDLALLDLAAADEQQREQLSAWSELQGVWCELLRQEGQQVMDQLEWGDYQIREAPKGKFYNPSGLFIRLIRENIKPPENFETSRKRQLREAAARTCHQQQEEKARLELAYIEYREHTIERHIQKNYSKEFYESSIRTKKVDLLAQDKRLKGTCTGTTSPDAMWARALSTKLKLCTGNVSRL